MWARRALRTRARWTRRSGCTPAWLRAARAGAGGGAVPDGSGAGGGGAVARARRRAARRRGDEARCVSAPARSAARAVALRRSRRRRSAHPLGNFSVNHLSRVLDLGGPGGRPLRPRPGRDPDRAGARPGRAEVLRRKLDEVARGLDAHGRRPARRARAAGGAAAQLPRRRRRPRHHAPGARPRCCRSDARGASSCTTAPSPAAIGWKAIVTAPGEGTAVRTTTPSGDPTDGLRTLPEGPAAEPARPNARPPSRVTARRAARSSRRGEGGRRGRAAREPRSDGLHRPVRGRGRRAAACSCCCSWPRSAGERSTRCRPATARRWSPRISSAPAAARATPWCSARP